MATLKTALEVADWRLRVSALYAKVREHSIDDPAAAHRVWRTERNELFATHPASPLMPDDVASFTGLPVAEYDRAWRFECTVAEPLTPSRMDVTTGTDGVVPFELVGTLKVPDVGSLDVWRLGSYGGGLFLPVRDALAGKPGGTYGGGRYLLDTVKGAHLGQSHNGALIIDFNFVYNPSCAYDPAWACPLPQSGNTLEVPVPVGELYHAAGR